MKKIIPFSLAASMATAGILYGVSPAQALTWTFSYESNFAFNYGTQSGTFEAPGSEIDGTHNITQFQFDHTDNVTVGAKGNFDVQNNISHEFVISDPDFTNQITISGGEVTKVSILVNNNTDDSSISVDFQPAGTPPFNGVDIYNAVNRGDPNDPNNPIDQSEFNGGVTFTSGADYEHNPVPAVLIIGVVFAINKLRSLLRNKKNSNEASESDSSRSGASETGQ